MPRQVFSNDNNFVFLESLDLCEQGHQRLDTCALMLFEQKVLGRSVSNT
jgi:hypothetical protein